MFVTVMYDHTMLGQARGGPQVALTGAPQEWPRRASTRTGELFQQGGLCPQQTLRWRIKTTTNRNRVK